MSKQIALILSLHVVSLIVLLVGAFWYDDYRYQFFTVLIAYAIKCFAETLDAIKVVFDVSKD